MKNSKYVIIGDIVNTHGTRGELRVLSDSDFKDERFVIGNKFMILNKEYEVVEEVILLAYRVHKNFDLVSFENFGNINLVEKYKGHYLALPKSVIRDLLVDEGYYFSEIQACTVIDNNAEIIGNVYKIVTMPTYDLWYIKRAGKKDLLLPFTDQFVKQIDIEKKQIIIELLSGMESF